MVAFFLLLTMEELSRRSVTLNKFQEIYLTWCDSGLAVRTDKQIRYYRFSYNLNCIDKQLDCLESILKVPLTSPATHVHAATKFIKAGINGMDLTQLVTDSALWPYNKNVLHKMANFTGLEWSPHAFTNSSDKIMAILNNVGSVEFYKRHRNTWLIILSLASVIKNEFSEIATTIPTNIKMLKEAAYVLESCAICWGSELNENGLAYFVTAQKNGTVLFWLLKYQENIVAQCCGKIDTDTDEIVCMKWIPKGPHFLLICSTILGEIIAYECTIENQKIKLFKRSTLWHYKDRMVPAYINYTTIENQVVLICSKNRHLLVQIINSECGVQSQFVENINDYKISGVAKCNNFFYMCTVNSKLYKIICSNIDGVLDVKLEEIHLNSISPTFELQGLSFSRNGAMGALAFIDRRIMHRKEHISIDLIFLCENDSECKAINSLLQNPSKKLTGYWDYIEMLRCKTMKTKTLPPIDYKELLVEGDSDVYKLKIYLILLTLSTILKDNIKIYKNELPELSIECIKNKILFAHFCSMIQNLCSKYLNNGILNEFEKECFVGASNFLSIYSQDNQIDIEKILPNDKKIVTDEYVYTCQCCDENLKGMSCANEHLNVFCLFTFTPIEGNDYLFCEKCGMTARFELSNDQPMCVFCDFYLRKS